MGSKALGCSPWPRTSAWASMALPWLQVLSCSRQVVSWGKESDRQGTEAGRRGRRDLHQQVHIPAEHCAESQVTCQTGQYKQISSFLKGLKSRGISTEGLV